MLFLIESLVGYFNGNSSTITFFFKFFLYIFLKMSELHFNLSIAESLTLGVLNEVIVYNNI
jgi:hypothetical protein